MDILDKPLFTYDLPKIGYVVGLDMQHTCLENKADGITENIIGYTALA